MKFDAKMARELSSNVRNGIFNIFDYILYNANFGKDFVVVTKYSLYYKDAIKNQKELRNIGYCVNLTDDCITIRWRTKT